MGCSSPKEKLEEEIINMNINKIEIQMEKYKQMKLLGKDVTSSEKPENKKIVTTNNNNKSNRKPMALKTGKGARSKSMKSIRIKKTNTNLPIKKINDESV